MACVEDRNTANSSFSCTQSTIDTLTSKNKELQQDVKVLKHLVYLLNVELESRDCNATNAQPKLPATSSLKMRTSQDIDLKTEHLRMIAPLLKAFEETKDEKDELLSNYKHSYDEFSKRCKEIAIENDTLRQQIQESKLKAESTYSEWKKLHEKFVLVEEHNELLIRQIKLLQNKIRSIETVFKNSVHQCECENKELREKYESSRTELSVLQGRFSVLNEMRNHNSKTSSETKSDLHFFEPILAEFKKLTTELKSAHKNELQTLNDKIQSSEKYRTDLGARLELVTSERDRLRGYLTAVETEMHRTNSKFHILETELRQAKKGEANAKQQLIRCMKFIRELAANKQNLNESTDAGIDVEKVA